MFRARRLQLTREQAYFENINPTPVKIMLQVEETPEITAGLPRLADSANGQMWSERPFLRLEAYALRTLLRDVLNAIQGSVGTIDTGPDDARRARIWKYANACDVQLEALEPIILTGEVV